MALIGALPSLSWIAGFTTAPLTAAAPRWSATADAWEQSFTQLARDLLRPGGTEWTGNGAEAAQDSTDNAAMTARGASNQLRDAAGIATFGADQLDGLHAKTLAAIAEARGDGFEINEDLSVTDTHRNPWGSSAYAARQARAEEHAETIQSCAGQLLALDNQYAAKLEAATAGLDTLALDAPGGDTPPANGHNGIQLVSNHTWKEGPTPDAGDEPPTDPQQPQVRGLPPEGVHPPVPGDLTPGPASRPSEAGKGGQSLWDKHGGEWRYFPGDKYHNPHWDFNPHKHTKRALGECSDRRPPTRQGQSDNHRPATVVAGCSRSPGCGRTAAEPPPCPLPGRRDANPRPSTKPWTRRHFPAR